MKEFLSNSWVVSIISGIIVFLLTNTIVMIQNKRKYNKKIKDANLTVLNRLRGYIVDNGLPKDEIIEAIKHSVIREYNIKYNNILTTIALYEELVTDIIGNIYISNENKIKYINMLQEYLEKNSKQNINSNSTDLHDKCNAIEIEIEPNINSHKEINFKYELIISIIPAIITIISIYLSLMVKQTKDIGNININTIIILLLFTSIFTLKDIIEWFSDKK